MLLTKSNHLSRKKEEFEESVKRQKSHEDILVNTIDSISNMPDQEKDKYYEIIQNKYLKKRLVIYSRHRKIDELKKTYKKMITIYQKPFGFHIKLDKWNADIIADIKAINWQSTKYIEAERVWEVDLSHKAAVDALKSRVS